jgi:hypothetical protein
VWARQNRACGQHCTQLSPKHTSQHLWWSQLLTASRCARRARSLVQLVFSGSSQSKLRPSIALQESRCKALHQVAWVTEIVRGMGPRLDRSKCVPRTTGKAVYCLTDRDVRSRLAHVADNAHNGLYPTSPHLPPPPPVPPLLCLIQQAMAAAAQIQLIEHVPSGT